jgi:hypothetical protein
MLSQETNSGHLYGSSKYAHFSQITEHNKHLFPSFQYAKGETFILKKGDALHIPAKWWHWVKSHGNRCLSVNFWFKGQSPTFTGMPYKMEGLVKDWPALHKWTDEYLIDKLDGSLERGIWLWLDNFASRKRVSIAEFVSTYGRSSDKGRDDDKNEEVTKGRSPQREFAYLITAPDYDPHSGEGNPKIVKLLGDDFSVPFPDDMKDWNANFWMNFGGIDTGLHFDDEDGILCVTEGWKEVTLFSPDQSHLLHPYPLKPISLKPYHVGFCYNLYQVFGVVVSDSAVSSEVKGSDMSTCIKSEERSSSEVKDEIKGSNTLTCIKSEESSSPEDNKPNLMAETSKEQHFRLQSLKMSSSDLLQVSTLRTPNVASFTKSLQDTFGVGKVVYSVKCDNGTISWEFYFYGLDATPGATTMTCDLYRASPMSLDRYVDFHFRHFHRDKYDFSSVDRKGLMIYSIDVTEVGLLKGETPAINLYYSPQREIKLPSCLVEKTFIMCSDPETVTSSDSLDDTKTDAPSKQKTEKTIRTPNPKLRPNITHRCVQVIEKYQTIFSSVAVFFQYGASIGIAPEDLLNLIKFIQEFGNLSCLACALANKGEQVGLYMLGISYDAFMKFLLTYDYPVSLIMMMSECRERSEGLQFEVGFHFKKGDQSHTPFRTAFYGIL